MKNINNLIIYVIIIILCLVTFTGLLGGTPRKADSDSASDMNTYGKTNAEKTTIKEEAMRTDTGPIVGIGLGNDYGKATETAIKNAGGLKDLIKKGDVVLIKPNICTLAEPGSPIITDYRTVQKVVDMIMEFDPAKIIVAEGAIAGNAFESISLKVNKYGELKNVELLNLNDIEKEDCKKVMPQNSATGKELYIPQIYLDADVVINIAKLKTHHQAVVTLSLKNAFGIPSRKVYAIGEYKLGLHNLGMNEAIVDINLIRKPDLSVIEGLVGGEGHGPINNTSVESNIMFAGRDPVALDTVALTFMGFKVGQVPHVKLAAKKKLGISSLNKIKIVGADLNEIKMNFKSEFKK